MGMHSPLKKLPVFLLRHILSYALHRVVRVMPSNNAGNDATGTAMNIKYASMYGGVLFAQTTLMNRKVVEDVGEVEERRLDADQPFTKQEFLEYYGRLDEWDNAAVDVPVKQNQGFPEPWLGVEKYAEYGVGCRDLWPDPFNDWGLERIIDY